MMVGVDDTLLYLISILRSMNTHHSHVHTKGRLCDCAAAAAGYSTVTETATQTKMQQMHEIPYK